ncbi:23S rRNA (uracil(1939)-C(5))-methyltransferase RlmD [Trichinella pseudospiralis]
MWSGPKSWLTVLLGFEDDNQHVPTFAWQRAWSAISEEHGFEPAESDQSHPLNYRLTTDWTEPIKCGK